MSDKEYIATIGERTTEELMSDMCYFGHDNYYEGLWEAMQAEIQSRLENYDKLISGELTVDEVKEAISARLDEHEARKGKEDIE